MLLVCAVEGIKGQKLGDITAGRLRRADQEMMEDRIPKKMEKCRAYRVDKRAFYFTFT